MLILINLSLPSKEMSHDFVWAQYVAETFSFKLCFSHVRASKLLIITPLYKPINSFILIVKCENQVASYIAYGDAAP